MQIERCPLQIFWSSFFNRIMLDLFLFIWFVLISLMHLPKWRSVCQLDELKKDTGTGNGVKSQKTNNHELFWNNANILESWAVDSMQDSECYYETAITTKTIQDGSSTSSGSFVFDTLWILARVKGQQWNCCTIVWSTKVLKCELNLVHQPPPPPRPSLGANTTLNPHIWQQEAKLETFNPIDLESPTQTNSSAAPAAAASS